MATANQYPRLNTRPNGVPKSTRRDRVSRAVKKGGVPDGLLKVRLDARTTITLKDAKALEFWRVRYPQLRIIKS